MTITITVPGTPIGKQRPQAKRRLGKGGKEYVALMTPQKTENFEALVKMAAAQAMRGRAPLEGAVEVEIALFVTPPASWSNKKRQQALAGIIRPTTRPDADNVIKALFDACNGICWRDDSQITDIVGVRKRYAETASSLMLVRAAV